MGIGPIWWPPLNFWIENMRGGGDNWMETQLRYNSLLLYTDIPPVDYFVSFLLQSKTWISHQPVVNVKTVSWHIYDYGKEKPKKCQNFVHQWIETGEYQMWLEPIQHNYHHFSIIETAKPMINIKKTKTKRQRIMSGINTQPCRM